MLPLPLELRAAAVLLALVAAVAGYATWAHKLKAEGAAQCQAEHTAADQAESTRRDAAKQENDRETQRLARLDRDHAGALAAAAPGLRSAVAAALGRCDGPAAVGISPPTGAASSVLAELSAEVDDRLRALAATADQRRTAGLACELEHDSLTP